MLKKTLTYKKLDGTPTTRDFYFNYFEHEFAKVMFREDNTTLEEYLDEMMGEDSGEMNKWKFLTFLEDIFGAAVGVPSEDGEIFEKAGARERLMSTHAYTVLLQDLMQNPQKALQEMVQMMPIDYQKEMSQKMSQSGLKNINPDNLSEEQMRAELAKLRNQNHGPTN